MATNRSAFLTLIAAYLGFFVGLIDANAINLALPAIRADLGGGISGAQWTADAYNVTFAALLLTAGSLGDRFGRRRLLRIGLLTFVAASLACALAPTLGLLAGCPRRAGRRCGPDAAAGPRRPARTAGWVKRVPRGRAVTVTDDGRTALADAFGIDWRD